MPPKRKVLATADANKEIAQPPAKKVAKGASSATVNSAKGKNKETEKAVEKVTTSMKTSKEPQGAKGKKKAETTEPKTAPKATIVPKTSKPKKFKYSNADTLTKTPAPEYVNMAWLKEEGDDDDEEEDEDPDDPKDGDIMMSEQDKRDQDLHGMCVYNDFTGYGIDEVVQPDFIKTLQKTVSPYKKWAFIEALGSFFKISSLEQWIGIDDSESLKETIDMIGTMVLTTLDVLAEQDILSDSASSPLPNIGITILLILEFVKEYCEDLEIMWAHEVVRQLDKKVVELKLRKEVRVSQEYIDELRAKYTQNEEENLYETHAGIENWKPEDDQEPDEFGDTMQRKWARWDWKVEFAEFKENHRGGNHFNLEKWSKADKAPYTFGSKEYNRF